MNMASGAVVLVLAMAVMRLSVLQEAEAAGPVTCLSQPGRLANVSAANQLVQYVLESDCSPNAYCTGSHICVGFTGVGGNVVGSVCAGGVNYCPAPIDFGNMLNEVLAECINQNNEVQGFYTQSDGFQIYLTAVDCWPDCIGQ